MWMEEGKSLLQNGLHLSKVSLCLCPSRLKRLQTAKNVILTLSGRTAGSNLRNSMRKRSVTTGSHVTTLRRMSQNAVKEAAKEAGRRPSELGRRPSKLNQNTLSVSRSEITVCKDTRASGKASSGLPTMGLKA